MEIYKKPNVLFMASMLSTIARDSGKRETLNGHFERMVITVASISVAFLFLSILGISIFYA